MKQVLLGGFLVFGALATFGTVDPAPLFNHNLVLQRDRKVPVWGRADPGEKFRVAFAGQSLETTADPAGKWRVDLAPMAASCEPRNLTVGGQTYTNVVVGEVWLCSGQSNMSFELWQKPRVGRHSGRERNGYYDALLTDEPLIRAATVGLDVAAEPKAIRRRNWIPFVPANFKDMCHVSAVGFHYAQRLHETLKVPVGIIISAWGGSHIEPWISPEGYHASEHFVALATQPVRMELTPDERERVEERRRKEGWGFPQGLLNHQPRSIYYAMIAPLEPYAFRGVIWYQGEANQKNWKDYYELLTALKRGWAKTFENPDMAFYLAQIAPYNYGNDGSVRIREEMARFGMDEPNCGTAVLSDVGELDNIHPGDKRTVGTRLAALALNRTYGFKHVPCDAPALASYEKLSDGRLRLVFNHVRAWCMNGDCKPPFEVAGTNGVFVAATCGDYCDNTLVLTPPKGVDAVRLSYMRVFSQQGFLRNEAGLPLGPFVCDVAAPLASVERTETDRWQAAIDAVARKGGGVVSIPAGRHLVGQLDLRSNVELHLEKGAILEGAVGMRHYRVTELPYSEGTWSSVVSAMNVTNVAVTGEGEIFGNGGAWPQPLSYGGNQEGTRPRGLVFGNVRGLRLWDFRLRDAACWGIVCKCCEDVEIRRVTVDSHANANNDGMDIEARNVVIADCDIDSGDDGVCLKSNHPEFVVENVLVTNVVSRSHCNALKIGTATHGTVRNVLFIDCRAAAPRREFIDRRPGKNNRRWYENEQLAGMSPGSHASESSGWSSIAVMNVDGGIVENVTYRNIVANGSKTPIFVRGGRRLKRSCGTPPSDKWIFRNVLIENVTGTALSSVPSSVTGVDGCRVDGCTLRNVHLKCRGLGAEESAKWLKEPVPENPGGYPEAHVFGHALPAWGLYARHVNGLRLENCTFDLLSGTADSRQKIVLDDVTK